MFVDVKSDADADIQSTSNTDWLIFRGSVGCLVSAGRRHQLRILPGTSFGTDQK